MGPLIPYYEVVEADEFPAAPSFVVLENLVEVAALEAFPSECQE